MEWLLRLGLGWAVGSLTRSCASFTDIKLVLSVPQLTAT